MSDLISRQEAIKELEDQLDYNDADEGIIIHGTSFWNSDLVKGIIKNDVPSAEPKYTDRELEVFRHGISIRLLDLRSAQHWRYDEDTAEIIAFLEQLYEKVGADMREESKNAKPDM